MENSKRDRKKKEWDTLIQQSPEEIRAWAERTLQEMLDEPFRTRSEEDLVVLETQKDLVSQWNQKYDSINHQSCKVRDYQRRHPEQCVDLKGRAIKPMLAGLISEERLPYAYEVLGYLIRATEQCGGWTEGNMVFMMMGIPVSFTIFESRDKKMFHPDIYKDKDFRGRRCRKRTFIKNKKLDLTWNGNLAMIMPDGKRINLKFFGNEPRIDAESMAKCLFQSLWSYAVTMLLVKKDRRDQLKQRQEHALRHNMEVLRLETLHQMMEDHDKAEKLRRVMQMMKEKKSFSYKIQAIYEKANQLDPYLSRRQEHIDFFHLRDMKKCFPIVSYEVKAPDTEEITDTDEILLIFQEEAVADRIRKFASSAMRRKVCNLQWLKWALQKADWYDPKEKRKDNVLGVRKWGDPIIPKQIEMYYLDDPEGELFWGRRDLMV